MENFLKSIIDKARSGEELTLSNTEANEPLVMVNPEGEIAIDVDCDAQVVLVHSQSIEGDVVLNVANGVKLSLVNVFVCQSKLSLDVVVEGDASCNISSFDLAGADVNYQISLNGRGANAELNTLQLTTSDNKSKVNAVINHLSSDCTSQSLSKCVAAGVSRAEFHGLVYVAKDAQRTISEQNSRNIQLSNGARIISEPQLEIYADDVKCTHGSTVGQMNDEAIFYMMQRGMSRDMAQKLHLEGFVDDIVNRCSINDLVEELKVMVEDRLHQI